MQNIRSTDPNLESLIALIEVCFSGQDSTISDADYFQTSADK